MTKFKTINKNEFAVVILAAGLSTRMHQPKAFLPYNNTEMFLEHIIAVYKSAGIQYITVIVNSMLREIILKKPFKNQENIIILVNHKPDNRLYSVQLGVKQNLNKNIYIQNIDNPFVTNKLVLELANKVETDGFINPYFETKGGHPILLGANVAKKLLNYADKPLNIILRDFTKIKLNVNDKKILANINTPEDYKVFFNT